MPKRTKTKYPGVYFREAERIGGRGIERVYYVVIKKDGKVIEEKVGRQYADDMTPAKASAIRSELIEGKRLHRKINKQVEAERQRQEAGKWTIDKLWKEYSGQRKPGKGLSIDQNRYALYLEKLFGQKEPHEIIILDIDRLRINLLKKKSPQTVKHALNLLTWIINFGVKKGLCQGIPFKIQKPPVDNIRTEDLTPDQLNNLLIAIDADENRDVANMMKLALFSGLRRGEMFNLKWRDIDFDRGFITINDPKGGKSQKIPLNDSARAILESQKRTRSAYVFPGQDGQKRVTASKASKRIRKNAGLPEDFRPFHGLRHVFASMLASSGKVDMYTLQKLLTHKSPQMTQRYAHLRDDALKRASDLAGSLVEDIIAEQVKKRNASPR
ncbi:MAG: site-specific integrase [Desulfobacterales bacterium]|jgi:integrase|nr:site-specific integrase [Desulfobacterales bacterium]